MTTVAPGPQFYAGIILLICLVAAWGRYVEWRFKNCRCTEKPTLLRPKWRKVDVKDDFDRYDSDGGAA